MTTSTQAHNGASHSPTQYAVSDTLKQKGSQATSTPSPNRQPSPLMHPSPGAFALTPVTLNGARSHTPVSESNMRHPDSANVTTSACQSSHASALVSTASHDRKPRMTAPSGLGGTDSKYATSLRHHEDSVYENDMKIQCMAFPLSSPSTIRIGDVGFTTPQGGWQRLFNISDPAELPPYFSPLNTPIRPDDICQYLNFEPHTYLTSPSIRPCPNPPSGSLGSTFQTSASEGSILALPAGAMRTELREISKFREFISINSDNWTRCLKHFDDRVSSLRLVTGQLCTPFWGIAAFAGNKDGEVTLEFSRPNCEEDSKYAWAAPANVKTSVSGKVRFTRPTDTVAIASYTITPRCFSKSENLVSKTTSPDEGEPIKIDEPASSNVSPSGQTVRGTSVNRAQRHPCDYINEELLSMSKAKIAVSHDRDWCAVLSESDKTFPEGVDLVERVFAANEVCHDDEVTFLRWKPKRVETATPADLLKDIDGLRDTLDEIGESDLVRRADVLHSITKNILTYLRVSKNKDPRDSNFLLSIAVSNVYEEVKIMSTLGQDRAPSLHLYAATMWAKFQTGGDSKFLEQAISSYRKAIVIDRRHTDSLSDLAMALWTRFTRGSHRIQDLDEVIVFYRTLLFNEIANSPRIVEWLNGLGLALWERYKHTKSMNDMDHAISSFRRASVSYPIPCDPFTLSNLGNILMAKARAFKDISESDEAISFYRKALNSVTPLHPNRSAFLSNLGDALSYRYDRRCLVADLNEAIRCYERALELPSPHHRDRVSSLLLCADKLRSRYNRSGDVEDLELAVKQYQEAKSLATPSHPKYAMVVESLVLSQREMVGRSFRRRSDFVSPPPSSNQTSPSLDHAQVPLLRPSQWPSSHPLPTSTSPFRNTPKFRIVSRSHTMKPYSRHRHGSSASDSESSSSHSFASPPAQRAKSPHHYHRPGTQTPRRHHTLPAVPL